MKKPTIELKKIKWAKSLSQETPAYTATLWVDGKPFGTVENSGQGGPDHVTPHNGQWKDVKDLDDRIKATFDRTDPSEHFPEGLERDLELVCHEFLYEDEFNRTWKRKLKSLVGTMGRNIYTWPKKYAVTEQSMKVIEDRGYQCLNRLPVNEAIAIIKTCN